MGESSQPRATPWSDRIRRFGTDRKALWLIAAYGTLAVYFTWPILSTGGALGIADWDPVLVYETAVLKSAYEYGQLPFWNPWVCGGDVLWQNPQVPLLSPAYPIALIVGSVAAMKINVLLHYLVGAAGMHLLLMHVFRLRAWWSILFLASCFTFAGGIALHIAVGHAPFLTYFYLPWVVFFTVVGVDEHLWRGSLAAAAILALDIWNGGIHIAFMSAVGLTCFLALSALLRREVRPLLVLAIVGIFSSLFAAPKLLPVIAFLREPGLVDIRYFPPHADALTWDMFVHSILDPFQYRRMVFNGQNYGWHEYGNYVGNFFALLTVACFVWIIGWRPWDRVKWLGVAAAVTMAALLLLAVGEVASFAPYVLIRKLPFLSQFRLPSRYLLVSTIFAVSTVAWVLRHSEMEHAVAGLQRLIAIVFLIALGFLISRNRLQLVGTFPLSPSGMTLRWMAQPPAPRIDSTTDGFSADSPMFRALAEGRDLVRCNETFQLQGSVDPQKPVVFAGSGAQVSHIRFGPNRVEFRAVVQDSDTRVFFNQRYGSGWKNSGGTIAIDPSTRLAYVTLPRNSAGRYVFSFFPPMLGAASVLWVIGVGAAIVLWRRRPGPALAPAGDSAEAERATRPANTQPHQ